MRDFFRYYFFKILMILVVLQLGFFAWLQYRNHRPVAVVDVVNVYEGHSVRFQPLKNDTDKDQENELQIHSIDKPNNGKVEQKGKSLLYIPNKDFFGVDSFRYSIYDGDKESKEAYIKVIVTENLAPVPIADYVQLYSGSNAVIAVLGNDSDREHDTIYIEEYSKPLHGELQKNGNEFIYKSDNSLALADSFNYIVSDGVQNSEKATVKINVLSKNSSFYPWLSADIGNVAHEGSLTYANNNFTVNASGADIWNNADGFHFVYQYVSGNCEIYVKVESLDNTNVWAKAGIMLRENLNDNSKNVFLGMTAKNGIANHCRMEPGDASQVIGSMDSVPAPYWLKLVRKGNNINGYASKNGKIWSLVGEVDIPMSKNIYIGLGATSHDNSLVGKSEFTHLNTKSIPVRL